jgi:hypothetical protein
MMTRSEIARRKRQMNRRIRELVAIRRATMSFTTPAPNRVATPATSTATTALPVTPAPPAGVAIRQRVNARTSLFPQIAPPRQLKASAPRAPLNATKAPLPPVCP